jgi:hypothetical protein
MAKQLVNPPDCIVGGQGHSCWALASLPRDWERWVRSSGSCSLRAPFLASCRLSWNASSKGDWKAKVVLMLDAHVRLPPWLPRKQLVSTLPGCPICVQARHVSCRLINPAATTAVQQLWQLRAPPR